MSRGCKCTAAAGEEGKSEQVEAYYRSGRAYARPEKFDVTTHTQRENAEILRSGTGQNGTRRMRNRTERELRGLFLLSFSFSFPQSSLSLSLTLCGGEGGDGARPRVRREDARKGGNWRFASIALKAARDDRRNLVTGESQAYCAHPRRVARSGSAEARISTKRP